MLQKSSPPNKARQPTSNSAFQLEFGSLLASTLGARSASEGLLAATERLIRRAARRTMNWEAIGAIGEVVGALGVIVTLAYLAAQIRQNTASIRASALQDMSEASASFHDLLASNAELGNVFVAGTNDLEKLTLEERVRFQFTIMAFVRRAENTHQQGSQKHVSPDEWAGLRGSYLSIMTRPGFQSWWSENSQRFNPGFVEWLNRELEEHAA